MGYWLTFQWIRFFSFLLSLLPLNAAFWLARQAGNLCYVIMPQRRRVALGNIRSALGGTPVEQRDLARASFQNAALSIVELFLVRKIRRQARERFRLLGNEHLEKAFAHGKGVLLVISHLGSWELLAFLPYLTGQPWSVIVKDIHNPYLNRRIDGLRREMNLVPISKAGSIKEVLRKLKHNEGVAVLIDQWAGGEGLWLDFFGRATSTTSIPARLAQKTGCLLVPAYCLRDASGHFSIHIEPAVESGREEAADWENTMTKKLNRILEDQIRAHPRQWTWTHRRWKDKPAFSRAA